MAMVVPTTISKGISGDEPLERFPPDLALRRCSARVLLFATGRGYWAIITQRRDLRPCWASGALRSVGCWRPAN